MNKEEKENSVMTRNEFLLEKKISMLESALEKVKEQNATLREKLEKAEEAGNGKLEQLVNSSFAKLEKKLSTLSKTPDTNDTNDAKGDEAALAIKAEAELKKLFERGEIELSQTELVEKAPSAAKLVQSTFSESDENNKLIFTNFSLLENAETKTLEIIHNSK